MLILISCHKEVDDVNGVPPNYELACSTVIGGEFLAFDEGAFLQNTFQGQ